MENGYLPRLSNPRTFNEHSLRTKLRPPPLVCLLSDKLEARQYVEHMLGEGYLPKLYFSGTSLSPSDFEALPSRFVFKANHGWGFTKLVANKAATSFAELFSTSRDWLSIDYSLTRNLELQYQEIRRRVFAEEFLNPEDSGADDYKFHVFRQSPNSVRKVVIEVHLDRFSEHKVQFFDREWKSLDIAVGGAVRTNGTPQPPALDEMLRVADVLSKPFPYCRIDLFSYEGRPIVGELTFTPSGAHEKFEPRNVDIEWGEMISNQSSSFF